MGHVFDWKVSVFSRNSEGLSSVFDENKKSNVSCDGVLA